MNVIPMHVFKHSFGPMITLLNDNDIKYQMREIRSGSVVASSGVIEIIANASIWVSLASVIIAFIKAKNSREIMITTKDNKIIHAKGLDSKQLQSVLQQAKDIKAIDTGKEQNITFFCT
jgi:hypothetical protein